jgi:CDP-paratose 2-epimerase
MRKILVTGGAGFAGSNLAIRLKAKYSAASVIAFDNLKRRGSELSLERLRRGGVDFVHGDVRVKSDLLDTGECDLVVDCAAEPSVLAGVGGSPEYVIQTNLAGTINCLELARMCGAKVLFLSTSRVYPVQPINGLDYKEEETRFTLSRAQKVPGASERGIAENFPLDGTRSIYGATKLSSELLLREYIESYKIQGIVNRCGVLTGPWQMGKVDQGVVVLWVAKHFYEKELSYIGFGGAGKQVRDILHVQDLFELISIQLDQFEKFSGETYNVGGGAGVSLSLRELTELCQNCTGKKIPIRRSAEDRPNDLITYISDHSKVTAATGWRPKTAPARIIQEIAAWIADNKFVLEPILS